CAVSPASGRGRPTLCSWYPPGADPGGGCSAAHDGPHLSGLYSLLSRLSGPGRRLPDRRNRRGRKRSASAVDRAVLIDEGAAALATPGYRVARRTCRGAFYDRGRSRLPILAGARADLLGVGPGRRRVMSLR